MDSLIPAKIYYDVYINFCLFFVFFTLLHTYVLKLNDSKNLNFIKFTGFFLMIILIFFIGQRPISYLFGDTGNYYKGYLVYQHGGGINESVGDFGWHVFMRAMAQVMNAHSFFTVCAFLYIFPMYHISKEFFKDYWYYAFLMFIVSFSFWTYGVNGIRNGIAASLFLWGVRYHHKKVIMVLFFLFAIEVHKTLFLPIIAFTFTYFYNDPKIYLKGWLTCIPLSLILGGVWITFFSNLGFAEDRMAGYLTGKTLDSFGTFRWDFLFHSAFAVFAGWYFIFKKKFHDKLYYQLFNTYLICNGFWILVIKANFSNRFAYLSWFMMAIVIIYPVLKQQFFKNQHIIIGRIIVFYFAFTYFMSYIYYAFIKVPIPNNQHTNF